MSSETQGMLAAICLSSLGLLLFSNLWWPLLQRFF